MKNVLGWVKANALLVVFAAVAVIALPTMLYFSGSWNSEIQSNVQGEIDDYMRTLRQASVEYVVEPIDPDQQAVSFRRAPNEATNQAIKKILQQREQASQELLQIVERRNKGGKAPLVENLFPSPQPLDSESAKRIRIAEVWPVAHERLLDRAGAGEPLSDEAVFQRLIGLWRREIDALEQQTAGGNVTPEQRERLREQLTTERLSIYRDHALDLRFYASPDVFANVEPWDVAERGGAPQIGRAWDWQHRYWVHQDIINAMVRANTDAAGQIQAVPYGPVKRIESISAPPWPSIHSVQVGEEVDASAQVDLTRPIELNYEISPTGRSAWPASDNPLYDIRYADVTILFAASSLPKVLDAISRENLMTVVDLDLEDVDLEPQLRRGYYYGSEHIVRATMRIETIWLRPWMARWMPPGVRAELGVPNEWAQDASDDEQQMDEQERTASAR